MTQFVLPFQAINYVLVLVTEHCIISNIYNHITNKACERKLIQIGQLKTGSRRVSKVRMTSNKHSTEKNL